MPQEAGGVTNILKFVQQAMDMPRNRACAVPMANAICEHHSGDAVAARKNSGEISAAISAGGHGNNVTVQAGKLQRAMRSLISCPQLHAPKGRISVFMQSEKSRSTFLEFVSAFTSAHPCNHISAAVSATRRAAIIQNASVSPIRTSAGNKSTKRLNTDLDTREYISMFKLNPRLISVVLLCSLVRKCFYQGYALQQLLRYAVPLL